MLVDAFEERALAVAAAATAPNTRRAYAAAYRGFAGFLRAPYGKGSTGAFTVAAVAAWRDHLVARGLAPASVAQRVCAARGLAAALVAMCWCNACAARGRSASARGRCLIWSCRTSCAGRIAGRGSGCATAPCSSCLPAPACAARRSPALDLEDVRQQGRQSDSRRHAAVAPARGDQTPLEVVVRASKRERSRTVPLHSEGLESGPASAGGEAGAAGAAG